MLPKFLTVVSLLLAAGLAQAGDAAHVVFVAGQAQTAGAQLNLGQAVQEGDEIATGADGYIYLKTIDNGFLILRPNSKARIAAYHVDPAQPANTRIKLELLSGVARAISGEGAKQAKQNFRFNTPVAAIGVRGTDFTVYTDQDVSRVTVISGGVVVSGFSNGCSPDGNGPCEGASSRELFARQAGQLVQVQKGQQAPQVLPSNGVAPDVNAPPRGDEPAAKSDGVVTGGTSTGKSISLDQKKDADLDKLASTLKTPPSPPQVVVPVPVPVPTPVVIEPPREIIWGRWTPLVNQPAEFDMVKARAEGAELVTSNSYYALLRAKGSSYQSPTSGAISFAMRSGSAVIVDEARANLATPATLENGQLNVNFAKATFTTSFDLVNQAERFKMQAKGDVTSNGGLFGENQFFRPTNMNVQGFLSHENGGSAAYLFDARLDNTRTTQGVTYWVK